MSNIYIALIFIIIFILTSEIQKTLGFKGHHWESDNTTHKWEKMFVSQISDKRCVGITYKENLNSKMPFHKYRIKWLH